MTRAQIVRQKLWERVYPFFPHLEWLARSLKFTRRQDYLLGWLHPESTLHDVREHLRARGFEHVVAAWIDDGQLLSWRKRISFEYQYHVRVFNDGEIRGHFEYTPEAAPLLHILEIGQEQRFDDFRRFLEGHLVETKIERFL